MDAAHNWTYVAPIWVGRGLRQGRAECGDYFQYQGQHVAMCVTLGAPPLLHVYWLALGGGSDPARFLAVLEVGCTQPSSVRCSPINSVTQRCA